MKKTLLLASFAIFATMASAQTVIGLATADELTAVGLSGDKVEMEPVTILDNEAGTFGLAYKDNWGTTNVGKTYKTIKVGNSEEINLSDYKAAVGNSNPTFVRLG